MNLKGFSESDDNKVNNFYFKFHICYLCDNIQWPIQDSSKQINMILHNITYKLGFLKLLY